MVENHAVEGLTAAGTTPSKMVAQPPAGAMAARRALGAQLAALRDGARLTQQDLARQVGYVRSTVGNVEIGRQRVPRRFWVQCDEIFSTGGVLTEGCDRVEAMEREAAWTIAQDMNSSEVTGGRSPSGRRVMDVDPALVLHWSAMLRVLASVHNLFGPGQVHDAVCREMSIIRRYRDDAVGEVKTGLLGVEARWAEFASWTADNVGDRRAGIHWLDRALGLARQAGDAGMMAYVFMRQAQQAADRLNGARAAALAARASATAVLTHRDLALCAIRQAQGFALQGDRGGCAGAIKAAYRLVARARDGSADDDPGTIGAHCGVPYVRAHEAYCQLRLGRATEAARILEDVLDEWPQDLRQDQALARAWLALSYNGDNRLAEAAAEGSRALMLAKTARSARVLHTLGQLDARLASTSGGTEVEQFRAAFSAATLTRRM